MKTTLEFTMPEESEELQLALKGGEYLAAIHDVDEWLRRKIKDSKTVSLQEVRDYLRECIGGDMDL